MRRKKKVSGQQIRLGRTLFGGFLGFGERCRRGRRRGGKRTDLHQCGAGRRFHRVMRSELAAHGVEVNRNAGGHNDRLRMKIGKVTGGAIDDENADQQNDRSYRASLGTTG